jgi:hypothetical protein
VDDILAFGPRLHGSGTAEQEAALDMLRQIRENAEASKQIADKKKKVLQYHHLN